MKIPKYVQEIMRRSRYEFDFRTNSKLYAAGYTLRIFKATPQTSARTFRKEIERLCKWADRTAGVKTAHILYEPVETVYREQSAVVTIFDPVMQHIEVFLRK